MKYFIYIGLWVALILGFFSGTFAGLQVAFFFAGGSFYLEYDRRLSSR